MVRGNQNAYDLIQNTAKEDDKKYSFEIYHLTKRGKQHVHIGTVQASNHDGAMANAKKQFDSKTTYNIWSIRTDAIRFTSEEEKDLWLTLPEKKFRDAADYKGGDKLKEFLERAKN